MQQRLIVSGGIVPVNKQKSITILIMVVCVQVPTSPRPPLRREDTGLRHHPEVQSGITGVKQRVQEFLFLH